MTISKSAAGMVREVLRRLGKVDVGPNQSASGNGAEKMERDYSRHAPAQTGVQRATERLGEANHGHPRRHEVPHRDCGGAEHADRSAEVVHGNRT